MGCFKPSNGGVSSLPSLSPQAMAPTGPSVPACAQAAQALVEEAGWLAREPVEVSSGALRTYRKRLQVTHSSVCLHELEVVLGVCSEHN